MAVPRPHRPIAMLVALVLPLLAVPGPASAASSCGSSDGHTLCVTTPAGSLSGEVQVQITNASNSGKVIVTWRPSSGSAEYLITRSRPSPQTNDYSFVWPTQKYRDGSGVLRVQHGSTSKTPVDVPVTLSNGNASGFDHNPNDWADFLPGPWQASADPVVAASGDGPADEAVPNGLAASIAAANPALFLFLGDIYEQGTFTENRNAYGVSALDGTAGTLWGALATKTVPTLGNHEAPHPVDWTDYWHGRPRFTSLRFGGVLFLDLDSNAPMKAGSAQYAFVQDELATAPPCVVAFWHAPVLSNDSVSSSKLPMWSLLANNGGDLVLNGHRHSMAEYRPLTANLQLGGHMVELISGAGGHSIGKGVTDSQGRLAWTLGKVAGAVYLTLNGAANGGTATSIDWVFRDVSQAARQSGSVTC